MNRDTLRFIDAFFREIDAGDAAVFAGAGLSASAGYVDWRNLLRDVADELDLDVEQESDLVSLAQFHVNHHRNNRHRINQAIISALSFERDPTENHRLLSRLPITTWWTTNYDQLIERALREVGKVVDVKSDVAQLANTRPRRDAIVYKMHGDIDRPNDAVVTRDDYERYSADRGAFVTALAGDLVSKTFLFLGFSFTDPNLDQILSRVRISFNNNQRQHFAIFRERKRETKDSDEQYAHAKARQLHVIEDLKRFNIRVLLVSEYDEITAILRELERRYRRRTVFVSASASDFAPWGEQAVTQFMRSLGDALMRREMRIATGLGLGVGNALFTGAVERIIADKRTRIEEALVIRPFPQAIPDYDEREAFWRNYRRELIGQAGIALFLFGNKEVDGQTVEANGMRSEWEIARELDVILVPAGATGSMAATLAAEQSDDAASGSSLPAGALTQIKELAQPTDDLMALVEPIADLVARLREPHQ